MQLADPKYQGKLALAPGETDFQPIVTSVLKTYGKAATLTWLDKIKANAASHTVPDNETLVSEVNRGQVAFGVLNEYYWYRLKAEIGATAMHSQIAYFAPHDPGYVIDVSGAAVLKSSAHQAAAQKFLAFLVSKQGEEIIGRASGNEQSYEYPLGSGRDHLGTGDAVRPAAAQPDHDRRARRRRGGHRPAPSGRLAVTVLARHAAAPRDGGGTRSPPPRGAAHGQRAGGRDPGGAAGLPLARGAKAPVPARSPT